VVIRKATKGQLAAQRDELLALRGPLTQGEWTAILGVPGRTYIRYELGQRLAPEHLMRFARVAKVTKKKRRA
jgi:uncharacterized protein (DUF2384 family)